MCGEKQRATLLGTLLQTYFGRARPKRNDLGLSLRLLRRLRDAVQPGAENQETVTLCREVDALLARYRRAKEERRRQAGERRARRRRGARRQHRGGVVTAANRYA